MESCQDNPLVCDPNAFCMPVNGKFGCQCQKGYLGDGHTCEGTFSKIIAAPPDGQNMNIQNALLFQTSVKISDFSAVPVYDGNYLVSSQGMALMKIPMNSQKPGSPIYVKSFMTAAGLDVDCFRGKVQFFVTETSNILKMYFVDVLDGYDW